MCGIAGIVSDRTLSHGDRDTVRRMLSGLSDRGPDGRGIRTLRTAVLGHTRLAIIDPESGQQPIGNEDGTVWIVANGEIYNYRELRRELESRGHRFTTSGDAETVLHLYEELGPACVRRLRGMFALAIWDDRQRALLLARDAMGIKPLYYARCGAGHVFASRLDAVLEHGEVSRDLRADAVHDYLTYHYVPSPKTILRDVMKLQPAEYVIIKDGSARAQIYWDVPFTPDTGRSEADWMDIIRDGLEAGVAHHLVADVAVGAFLSGGLDSSAVVSTMARICGRGIGTHTVGFEDPRFDERREARALATALDADHHEGVVRPDPMNMIDEIASCFDEPFADPSAVPTLCASRLAREHVKCVLSGDGGDELFAGYSRYLSQQRQRALRRLAHRPYLRPVVQAAAHLPGHRVQSAVRNLAADLDHAHFLNVAWFDPEETRALLNSDVASQLEQYDPFQVLQPHFANCPARDVLARSQYVDLKTWLADGVLCKTDRASMACGLEVRVPLLDVPFVEAVSQLPESLKIRDGQTKYALRRAMEPVLGPDVVGRTKRGFEVPLDAWMTGPLRPAVLDLLLSPNARINEWIDADVARRTFAQLEGGRRGLGARLWSLLMLELWAERVVSTPARAPSAAEAQAPVALAEGVS